MRPRIASATLALTEDDHALMLVFASYYTPRPKNDLGDDRTIGRISLIVSDPNHRDGDDA